MLCSRFERPQINEIDASGRHCMNAGSIEPETLSSSSGDGPATSSMRVEGGKRSKPHEKVKRKVCCPFISWFTPNSTLSRLTQLPLFRCPQSLETKTAKKPVCMHGNCIACSFLMMCATGDLH